MEKRLSFKKYEKNMVLFDNDYTNDLFEETKEYLFEEYKEDKEYETIDDVSDSDVWDEITFRHDCDWQEVRGVLEKYISKYYLIAVGTIGGWRGNRNGGKFIENMRDFNDCISDCDYIKLALVDGELTFEGHHHDGSNYITFREVTDKGYEYHDKNYAYVSDEELHDKLFNGKGYSRKCNGILEYLRGYLI